MQIVPVLMGTVSSILWLHGLNREKNGDDTFGWPKIQLRIPLGHLERRNLTNCHQLVVNIFQEKALGDAQEGGSLGMLAREIDELQSEKRKIDNELRQLREEQQAMHMQSKTQAELDMKTKEKRTKENAIQQM